MRYRVTVQDGKELWPRPCDAAFVLVSKSGPPGPTGRPFSTAEWTAFGDVPLPLYLDAFGGILEAFLGAVPPDAPDTAEKRAYVDAMNEAVRAVRKANDVAREVL